MSPTVRLLCLLAVFLLPATPAKSQRFNLRFDQYNTDNGLSQNEVFDIVQDQRGFIWIGTDEGLNRFDGHDFRIFRNEQNDPHSVIGNSIQALAIDRQGILWIGTTNGLSRYYPATERVEQLNYDFADPTKPNGVSVTDMLIHDDGSVWVSYLGDGVDAYFPDKKEFRHYTSEDSSIYKIKNDYITALLFLPSGEKIFGSRDGVIVLDTDGVPLHDSVAIKRYPWMTKIDNSTTCFLLSRDQHTLWIGTELHGFYMIDLRTNDVQNFTTSNSALSFNNNVPSLFEDSEGNIWIGGETIHLYDKKTNTLYPYNEQGILNSAKTKNPILSIYEDREGNIWFGTFRQGLLKYNPAHSQVEHYHSRLDEQGLDNDQVLSFSHDDQNIWVGTDGGGLYKLNKKAGRLEHVALGQKNFTRVVKTMYPDKDGTLWIGTWDNGLLHYNPKTQALKEFNSAHKNFKSSHVWVIKPDGTGNLWLGTLRDGLCLFDPSTTICKNFYNIPTDSSSLVNNDIMCLMYDSEKSLWVGTSNGVSILKNGADKFVNLTPDKYPTVNMNILTIYEDDQKRMWLGTNGGGLVIMDQNYKVIKTLSEKEGLNSSTICSLQPDDHGNLWVSTYNGLFRISMKDLRVFEVPQFIGLQGKEFIPNAYHKLPSGELLFGGVNGFNLFHPDSLTFGRTDAEIVFTSLHVLNDEVIPDSIYHGKKTIHESVVQAEMISLTHAEYAFTLTFSPLLYTWQRNLHYSYMLEDLDETWQSLPQDVRTIHYTSLSPGYYTLKVRASFDGVTWSNKTTMINIYIAPPWWETLGFKIAIVVLCVIGLIGIYKMRVRYLTKLQQRLQILVSDRTTELEQKNTDLVQKNKQINFQNEEIQKLLDELAHQKDDIENKNQELSLINEQLSVQRDILELRGVELEKAKAHLQEINNNLEHLINRRTQKLNHTLHELETFLYRASHDLRGPISSMLGLIRVAALENQQPQTHNEFLQKTILKLERTLQKLMQKHTIQKSKVNKESLNRKKLIALIDHISKSADYFRPQDLDIRIADDFTFETDISMLNIVLTNLLENAFFFSTRAVDRKVIFEAANNNGKAIISVSDNGAGIKHDIRDKIFTMFFRGHESATGNGLGLYLVRDALLKINGQIMVETEEGVYSRFTVVLEKIVETVHNEVND